MDKKPGLDQEDQRNRGSRRSINRIQTIVCGANPILALRSELGLDTGNSESSEHYKHGVHVRSLT